MKIPVRTCIVTRARKNKVDLVRIVNIDGTLKVDLNSSLPGRGVYLLPELEVLETAIGKRKFGYALKSKFNLTDLNIQTLKSDFAKAITLVRS